MHSFYDESGEERFLGNLVPPAGLTRAWPLFGDTPEQKLIPRADWDDVVKAAGDGPDHPCLPYVHDQDGIGQCNCDATAALAEFARNCQGLPFVKLSAADLYDRINGGRDQGSMLEDAFEEMRLRGIGMASTSGTLWQRGMTQASAEERSRFMFVKLVRCPTFDHCFSATAQGWGIVSGVMWNDGFKVGSDGWLQLSRTGGNGGHAVFGYKPAKRGSEYGIWHQNSWKVSWGLGGRCVFPEQMYKGPVGGWWAGKLMVDEGGVIPTIKA